MISGQLPDTTLARYRHTGEEEEERSGDDNTSNDDENVSIDMCSTLPFDIPEVVVSLSAVAATHATRNTSPTEYLTAEQQLEVDHPSEEGPRLVPGARVFGEHLLAFYPGIICR